MFADQFAHAAESSGNASARWATARSTAVRPSSPVAGLRARPAEPVAHQERLDVRKRVVAAVHRGQQLPLLERPALVEHPPHRVAAVAGLLRLRIRFVVEVDVAALHLERAETGLVRGQPVVRREITHRLARVGRLDLQIVEEHHAADGLLPSLPASCAGTRCGSCGAARPRGGTCRRRDARGRWQPEFRRPEARRRKTSPARRPAYRPRSGSPPPPPPPQAVRRSPRRTERGVEGAKMGKT